MCLGLMSYVTIVVTSIQLLHHYLIEVAHTTLLIAKLLNAFA